MKKIWIYILLALVLWGGFLRFESLGKKSLWMDEAYTIATARGIQEHGYPLLDTGIESWKSFPVDYVISVGLYLSDDPQISARFFPALAGMILIFVFYLFNFQIFKSRKQALIATALLAFMTYEIAWSRQARMYIFLQLFITSSLYFYYRFIEEKKKLMLILAFIFAALSIYTHIVGYIVAIIILISTFLDTKLFKGWLVWIKNNKAFLAGFAGVFVVFVYSLSILKSASSLSGIFGNVQSTSHMDYSGFYLKFIFSQLKYLLPVAPIGLIIMLAQKKWRYVIAVSIATAVYFYMISFKNILLHFRYILPIIPFLFMFIAYAFNALIDSLKKLKIAGIIISSIIIFALFYTAKFNVTPKDYELDYTAPQPNWKQAYEFIRKESADSNIVTISAYPVFHDIYLGRDTGEKYFLPYSQTGYPGDITKESMFAKAEVINNLSGLKDKKGFVILDDFAYRMLKDTETRKYLSTFKPTIIPGKYKISIWEL